MGVDVLSRASASFINSKIPQLFGLGTSLLCDFDLCQESENADYRNIALTCPVGLFLRVLSLTMARPSRTTTFYAFFREIQGEY